MQKDISERPKGYKSAREVAKAYKNRGWKPIPALRGGQHPNAKGWSTRDFDLEDFSAFKIKPQNICVQMGRPSNGLTDVDLDCPTARKLAPAFLPETGAIFGRKSSERSHWLYYTELWKTAKHTTETFEHPDKAKVKGENDHGVVLVELRTGRVDKEGREKGAVSMFPGSKHHSGELIKWSKDGEPASVDGAKLRANVQELAAAILLVDHYPADGRRDKATLALGGALARAKYEQDEIEAFVEAVAKAASDEEWKKRIGTVRDKAKRWAENEPTQGRPKLREFWGDEVGDRIADWLGVQGSPTRVDDGDRGENEGVIRELAGLDPISYDQARQEAANKLNVRLGTLDEMVRKRRGELARVDAAETPPPDVAALAHSARDIINDTDVLSRFGEDFRKVIAGEQNTGKLLYLVATSRLFDKAMHAAVKGPSSGGKSEIRTRVLEFFPPEHVISFTALSERALLYMPVDFAHKVLSMGEAITDEETKFQDYLLRELMSEGKLRYPVVQKVHGELTTVIIERDGPVSFLVTTTRNKLNPENETRMLSLEIDDSEAQTKAVLRKVAAIEGYGHMEPSVDLTPWHDYQRWLAAGNCQVKIPFAITLGRMIPPKAVRLRRDIGQVLRAIKAHALLHRQHRKCNDAGVIVATIKDDYAAVRELMVDLLATSAEVKLRQQIVDTIDVIASLQPIGRDNEGVTVRAVAQQLKLDRSAAYRRIRAAEDGGYLFNVDPHRRTHQYRVADHALPEEQQMLPTPNELREAVRRNAKRNRGGARGDP